ncbi:MAG: biotin/lipoyl-containing protein [Burkholderiaceae bacterium]
MSLADLAVVYLIVGACCGVAVYRVAPGPGPRAIASAALAVPLWPLWAPIALTAGRVADRARSPLPGGEAARVEAALGECVEACAHGPLAAWSSGGRRESPLRLRVADVEHPVRIAYGMGAPMCITTADGGTHQVEVVSDDGLQAGVIVDGLRVKVRMTLDGAHGWLDAFGLSDGFSDVTDLPRQSPGGGAGGTVSCRMHGQLVRIAVEVGQRVARGEYLLSIEAMKMEHRFDAPIDGTVVEIGAAAGTQVAPGRLLVRIEPDPPSPPPGPAA